MDKWLQALVGCWDIEKKDMLPQSHPLTYGIIKVSHMVVTKILYL